MGQYGLFTTLRSIMCPIRYGMHFSANNRNCIIKNCFHLQTNYDAVARMYDIALKYLPEIVTISRSTILQTYLRRSGMQPYPLLQVLQLLVRYISLFQYNKVSKLPQINSMLCCFLWILFSRFSLLWNPGSKYPSRTNRSCCCSSLSNPIRSQRVLITVSIYIGTTG